MAPPSRVYATGLLEATSHVQSLVGPSPLFSVVRTFIRQVNPNPLMAPSLNKGSNDICSGVDDDPQSPVFSFKPSDGNRRSLAAGNHHFLHDVPPNILLTPAAEALKSKKPDAAAAAAAGGGCFIGFASGERSSRHVIPLGRLAGIPFMSIFRFKVWWTTLWTGSAGGDLEHETQFLLLDRSVAGRPYVLILPIVDGDFRASLQPGSGDSVDLCLESGSSAVTGSLFSFPVYIHAGDDPFTIVGDAMRVVRAHLGTFKLLEEKTLPPIVDKFGWCTWDAFYLNVHPAGVRQGVEGLSAGGCPPAMVLIDDGWQTILRDDEPITETGGMNHTAAGEQMPCRLVKFHENDKFKGYRSRRDGAAGMGAFVKDLKDEFRSVENVYVWHALCGYWGGLRPVAPGMPAANLVTPRLSPGLQKTMKDLAVDKIVNNGVGLVPPELAGELYEKLHSHLAAAGIDGVKVDVIHILEMLCEEYGGRVHLAKAYFNGLTQSVQKHFNGNGVIASMEHCNDFMLLGTHSISLGRVGDDFWCTDPSGDPNGTYWLQGCHMVHCAYNSLWMGCFILPDWDMFQSTHPCAAFHAASRAVSGGPVYASDSVGRHDFRLLKTLVLPDGSVLRCDRYALPTRDCLFADPLHDGESMLKIWNLNSCTGVLGAFNCQGGGWSPSERRNKSAAEFSQPVTAKLRPADIEWSQGKNKILGSGVRLFAVYFYREQKMALMKPHDEVAITLEPFNYELLTVSPVIDVIFSGQAVQFAPVGLTEMMNSGGAVQSVEFAGRPDEQSVVVVVEVKGVGEMKAFSSEKPSACRIDGVDARFSYVDQMVTVQVPWSGSSSKHCVVQYLY
ncbi:Galactinol--sucrose galactosyltransferase [Apostasia shenzhenica]|uniref:galactinol--sucrose galactosyltransferase n=1 Tax=Apostasia shenzhenica TaxID=1088818 RepID=A0A2I0AMJ9_9ASPA|nr:Galactinol--sucrose galactosyltransferase [Apostasia shenzhenica]